MYFWGIAGSSGRSHFEGASSCYTLSSLSLAGWTGCGIIEDDDLVAHGAGKFEQEFTISLRELQDSWEFCSWADLETRCTAKTCENVKAGLRAAKLGEMHFFWLGCWLIVTIHQSNGYVIGNMGLGLWVAAYWEECRGTMGKESFFG